MTPNADGHGDSGPCLTVRVPVFGSDPVTLGELLRELTFIGDGYGCYSTFDVRPDARELPHHVARWFFDEGDDEAEWDHLEDEDYSGYVFEQDGLTIEVFWYWDGDGTLAYRISNAEGALRIIENNDCKKSSRWSDTPSNRRREGT